MQMVLNRNYVLATPSGLHIGFTKGVPTHVPQKFVQLALNVGAEPVDEKDAAIAAEIQAETNAEIAMIAARKETIKNAIYVMKDKAESGDFTAGGKPNIGRVAKRVGFEVDRTEVDAIWEEIVRESLEPNTAG